MYEKKETIYQRHPKTNKEVLFLLEQMLQFNPYFRPKAAELLKNPIFDTIRIPANEGKGNHKIVLNFDRENASLFKGADE